MFTTYQNTPQYKLDFVIYNVTCISIKDNKFQQFTERCKYFVKSKIDIGDSDIPCMRMRLRKQTDDRIQKGDVNVSPSRNRLLRPQCFITCYQIEEVTICYNIR